MRQHRYTVHCASSESLVVYAVTHAFLVSRTFSGFEFCQSARMAASESNSGSESEREHGQPRAPSRCASQHAAIAAVSSEATTPGAMCVCEVCRKPCTKRPRVYLDRRQKNNCNYKHMICLIICPLVITTTAGF